MQSDDIHRWAVAAAAAADDKLATNTQIIDVAEVLSITDAFLITTGANRRQVRAIAEEIEHQLTEAGGPKPIRIEGNDTYEWVLMDYGGFVVHVFDSEAREFYGLERLWSDRPRIEWKAERSA